ncbi:hypothetical protein O988_01819 [Pseudogymnoascus sp. VKM F-3808]|nr:hypothetical protein O988_01819 [Pseudogymnoascus sp. VKM F-3808]
MNLLHPGAGLHGHEYSKNAAPPKSRSPSPRIALHRSPFSAPTVHETTPSKQARRLTTGQLSPTKPDRVAFLDPDSDDAMSDDGRSCGYSDGSAPAGRRKRKSVRHRSTSYYLAHPAPTLTQKQRLLHIRPKLLLQLQQLSADARPRPMVDVISASTFVPRLAKKFPNLYRGSGELGIHDVMIVRSDDYDSLDEEKEVESVTDDSTTDRDVLAVICQVPKGDLGTVEICLEDGSRWTAGPSAKGALELIKTDPVTGERTIARWVPRGTSRRNSLQTPARKTDGAAEPKYQFSFIDPRTRRHPILATLTQGTLKISETYSPVSNSEEEHPPISARTSIDGDSDSNTTVTATAEPPKILTVYQEQRLLIEVSAVWVALKQGWCPSFRYGDNCCSPTSGGKFATPPSSSSASGGSGTAKTERPRSFSLTPSGAGRHRRSRSNTVTSIPESVDSNETGTARSRKGVFKRATFSASTFAAATGEGGDKEKRYSAPPPMMGMQPLRAPERSFSNGAAFMQKAAARKAGRPGSRSGSDDGEGGAEGMRVEGALIPSPGFRVIGKDEGSGRGSPTKGRRASVRGKPQKERSAPDPPPAVKEKKENRRFSSIIKFFRGKKGGRS